MTEQFSCFLKPNIIIISAPPEGGFEWDHNWFNSFYLPFIFFMLPYKWYFVSVTAVVCWFQFCKVIQLILYWLNGLKCSDCINHNRKSNIRIWGLLPTCGIITGFGQSLELGKRFAKCGWPKQQMQHSDQYCGKASFNLYRFIYHSDPPRPRPWPFWVPMVWLSAISFQEWHVVQRLLREFEMNRQDVVCVDGNSCSF